VIQYLILQMDSMVKVFILSIPMQAEAADVARALRYSLST
jgi:hypothetical protein